MKWFSLPRFSLAQWFWASAAALLLVVVAWLTLPRPLAVETAVIDRGFVRRSVSDEGRTRIHDIFVVAAPVGGELQRISLHPGDVVAQGDIVATIVPADPSLLDARTAAEAEAVLAAAKAALVAAEADAVLAQRDRTRVAQLAQRGFAPRAALDAAEAALRSARALVSVRKAELKRAQASIGRSASGARVSTPVRSPSTGRVLRVLQESKSIVAAGAPLLEVGDPSDIEIVADFLTQDAMLIQAGARATLEGWGGDTSIDAIVTRVEPYAHTKVSALGVEEQRVNVILRLADPASAPPMGHGFRLDTRIIVSEEADALRAPTDALIRDGANWAVFRIDNGRARLTPVVTGTGDDRYRAILKGLNSGDRVILFPGVTLRDGARVRASDVEAASARKVSGDPTQKLQFSPRVEPGRPHPSGAMLRFA